jgi:hypothetical protein
MKKIKMGIMIVASLGIGFVSTSFIGDNASEASKMKEVKAGVTINKDMKEIKEVLKEVPFKVKLPNNMPMNLKEKKAVSMKLSGDTTLFSANYYGDNNDLITLEVLNSELKFVENGDIKEKFITLKNGKEARYSSYGKVQSLSWEENGVSYLLKYYSDLPSGFKGEKSKTEELDKSLEASLLSEKDLLEIADSLE